MSDTEHEDTEAPEPAQQPLEDDEAAEEEERASRDEEEPEEAVQESAPEEPGGMSEKELEQGRKKLEAEGTRHANRVSDILGEEAQHLVPCPLCTGFVDGFIFPVTPPDDVIERTRVAIGLPDLSNFQQAKNARQCDDCAGLGVVLSGSQVPENAAINCVGCNGSGYVVIAAQTGELVAPAPPNGAPTADLPVGLNRDDPAVKELIARGFTVFPPIQVPSGTP